MDSLSSPASKAPSIDDFFEHNMWNPLLEILFLEQVSGIFASCLVEIDLAKIALSCQFALDLLMLQGRGSCLCTMIHWAPLLIEFLMFLWHHCHPGVIVFLFMFGASLQNSVSHFIFFLLLEQFPLMCFRIHMWHW